MLLQIEIEAFKAYDDETLSLEPLTVLVGQNGSGKTSVLQSIEFLRGLVVGTLPDHINRHGWDYEDLPRLRAYRYEFAFHALLEIDGEQLVWTLRLGKRHHPGVSAERVVRLDDPADQSAVSLTRLAELPGTPLLKRTGRRMERYDQTTDEWERVQQTLTASWLSLVDPEEDVDRFPALVAIAQWARGIQPYVVLDPNRLREPSRATARGIGPAGANLAGFLRHLRTRRPDAFEKVLARVQAAYPRLAEVTIHADAGRYSLALRENWSAGPNPRLNARQASDGLLRLFALAAMPELEPRPTLLMIDELENGIHPELLDSVVRLLDDLTSDGLQVIATSHSPLVLGYVDAKSVLLTRRDSEGRAGTIPLVETKGYSKLHAALSAGEMWLALGEDGLVNGRADRDS